MRLAKLIPGTVVYEVVRYRMGNTTLTTVGTIPIEVLDVDPATGRVRASRNGNTPRIFFERSWKKWRATRPMLVDCGMGRKRLATRAERQAATMTADGGEGVCRKCGCTDSDCSGCIERTGSPCYWVEPGLCSACTTPQGV